MAISKFDVLKRMEQTGNKLHISPKITSKSIAVNGRGYITIETDPVVVQRLQDGEDLGLFLVAFDREEFNQSSKTLNAAS